jgi:DNA-binding GntR family transcriptional regulator
MSMKVNYRTVEELVTQQLRQEIVLGKFQAGQHLQQDDLAEKLGVSRIPIRSALRVLEAEGLVEFRPHKGVILTKLSREDLSDIFDSRILLECRATELAVPHLSVAEIEQMRGAFTALTHADDPVQATNLNLLLHHTLYGAAGRPHLLNLIHNLRNKVGPYLQAYLLRDRHSPEFSASQAEHEQLVRACERREEELAVVLIKKHLTHVLERLLAKMP